MFAAPHTFDSTQPVTLDIRRRGNVVAATGRHVGRLARLRRRAIDLAQPAPALRLRVA
jgi:hypothetical protein